jgi:hypothetical protein
VTPNRLHDGGECRAGPDAIAKVEVSIAIPSRAKVSLCRFSGWCSMNFDTSTLACRFGPAKLRGIGI